MDLVSIKQTITCLFFFFFCLIGSRSFACLPDEMVMHPIKILLLVAICRHWHEIARTLMNVRLTEEKRLCVQLAVVGMLRCRLNLS